MLDTSGFKSLGYYCLAIMAFSLFLAWMSQNTETSRDLSMDAIARHNTGPRPPLDEGRPILRLLAIGLGLVTGAISLYCFSKVARRS
ncbi:MAG: hypothetical protein ACJAZ8_002219 [Planctomycetota bacterium]|jgi:hypothetical protein